MKDIDPETGVEIEIPITVSRWVEPFGEGGTPMGKAFEVVRDIAQRWADQHDTSYPPVVVNVTDGEGNDRQLDEIKAAALAVRDVTTSDGPALVYNCHITHLSDPPVKFPSSETELPNDLYAQFLWDISSEIPDTGRAIFEATTGQKLETRTRGYIFNGDAVAVRQLLVFGSTVAGNADQYR